MYCMCDHEYCHRVQKKQIILLSRTSKNCGGQTKPPATCPGDRCQEIILMRPGEIIFLTLMSRFGAIFLHLPRSMRMFGQVNLSATCPQDKRTFFFLILSPAHGRIAQTPN